MRLVLLLALALAGGTVPASAQTAPPALRRPLPAEGTLRGAAPARPDAEIEAARLRSESRLREREDKARRTLKGICDGC